MISPHVLVIGSEPATLHSLSAMLAGTSYRAEESTLGTEALVRIRSDPAPELVLLELGKGNERGLRILQQVRAVRSDLAIGGALGFGRYKAGGRGDSPGRTRFI